MSLGKTILSGRVNLLLTALLVLSALTVVFIQHKSRSLFIAFEVSQTHARQLELDWTQLQLDQSTLSKSERVENISREQLGMAPLTPERTQYLEAASQE
mgnify:CR=1 FL=1